MIITFIDPSIFYNNKRIRSVERVFGCNYTQYPFPNIISLTAAALLKNRGYKINYIDAATLGWSKKKLEEFIKYDKSDVYSIHSVNLSKENDIGIGKIIRSIKNDAIIVYTGPSPTFTPEDFIFDEKVFVIRGEIEFTFIELLQKLNNLSSVKGISYRENNKVIHNQTREYIKNLDELPFPLRELVNNKIYFNPKFGYGPWTVMLTSRGCSYRCIYCVPNSLSFARELEYKRDKKNVFVKPPVVKRSASSIIEEFKLIKKQGYKTISIIDDNFIWDKESIIKICKGIKDLNLRWGCLSRADHIDEEIAYYLSYSGCKYVDIGVESFDQQVLDYIKKDLKVEKIYDAIKILKKYNIDVKLNILFGASPYQTKESMYNDIEIVRKLRPNAVMFSIVSPFPGTVYYEIVKENKWFRNGDYRPVYIQQEADVNYPNLQAEELEKIIKYATRKYYISISFILNNIDKIRLNSILHSLIALKRKIFFMNEKLGYEFVKRCMDIIISIFALILFSPLFLIVSILIKCESKGPIIFKQKRIGKNGKCFYMYKFRSMRNNENIHELECYKKNKNDPRITKLGKILRKTSIDELPQFINVLKNEMSVVGPRPLPPHEFSILTKRQKRRALVKPGITGLWQVSGRSEIPLRRWMAMDLIYVKKKSLLLDIYILLKTIPAIISCKGAW
jgi:lipopolysaccharide/colanic/teichoic acid biosynthesis glycosyltransferase/uncharacterized Fe-S cluster-containing MiaB family protein